MLVEVTHNRIFEKKIERFWKALINPQYVIKVDPLEDLDGYFTVTLLDDNWVVVNEDDLDKLTKLV